MSKPAKFRALTVGDGDLTLSLALARAYGRDESFDLVASTLLSSKKELFQTYSNSENVLQELTERNVTVLFGVDATKLSNQNHHARKWDAILFHHPHLGDFLLESNEQAHAQRHHVLLSHYFSSAKSCLGQGGVVHVCLCGRQPQTWRVRQAAERQGLELRDSVSTNLPIHTWLPLLSSEAAPVLSHYPAPRRFRNGKLGSKHFLGRYGYRHRRTHGDQQQSGVATDVNVSGSMHFVFATSADGKEQQPKMSFANECQVCGIQFDSMHELDRHHIAPALPDPIALGPINMNIPVYESKSVGEMESPWDDDSAGKVSDHDYAASTADTITPQRTTGVASDTNVRKVVASFTIDDDEHDGKRLKWYLRQHSVLSGGRDACRPSKQQAERMVKSGRVVLNGKAVLDSGRFLHMGDIVQVLKEPVDADESASKPNAPRVEIHYQADNLIVAFKPVAMRTIGSFSDQTLEMIVSSQIGESVKAVSKLDSGCSGLSVLRRSNSSPQEMEVTHVFTALVHGQVPESWSGLLLGLPVEGMRRWNKGGNKKLCDESVRADVIVTANENSTTTGAESYADSVEIHVLEKTTTTAHDKSPALSSLTISTTSGAGGLCNTICFLLRKQGYPVVNDRLCRREYLALPRSIRNLIKNRLCIGCYAVSWAEEGHERVKTVSIQAPDRLHASHWQSHRDAYVSAS